MKKKTKKLVVGYIIVVPDYPGVALYAEKVLWFGGAATLFPDIRAAKKAIKQTLKYRDEFRTRTGNTGLWSWWNNNTHYIQKVVRG